MGSFILSCANLFSMILRYSWFVEFFFFVQVFLYFRVCLGVFILIFRGLHKL